MIEGLGMITGMGKRHFSLHSVQIGSEAHLTSYPLVSRDIYQNLKRLPLEARH
jgi:hypothetical protein